MRVGLVRTRLGNLLSVRHALEHVGADVHLCESAEDIGTADRIVLPGVGAYARGIADLDDRGLREPLTEAVVGGIPLLGICLGMQLMARRSDEGEPARGLGWLDADVRRLAPHDETLRVPHVGWNEVGANSSPLFAGIPPKADFYFVHSYHVVFDEPADTDVTCDYGGTFVASTVRGNVAATQFHPEKSQDHGLRLLENFLSWAP